MSYRLTDNPNSVIQLSDGATVPRGHRFWFDYEAWLAAGGLPEPAFQLDPAVAERVWRDAEIEGVKWLRERHRDQVDSARPTTLSPEQSGELLDYVQALRDWPQSAKFPAQKYRPKKPGWIAEQTQ
ncbi:phage tail assembly chaperone [Pseudomonas sp. UBA4034]|jgi:hypothetical protein|uniref:phage tail assembly chaperone n=1 Tax=Pseudomonas sp. UBA4034 TaxID=1947315 RepID=UPI0025808136|nr:phage tail assembly chaperone [Pseudomonas sp. UBA4034]